MKLSEYKSELDRQAQINKAVKLKGTMTRAEKFMNQNQLKAYFHHDYNSTFGSVPGLSPEHVPGKLLGIKSNLPQQTNNQPPYQHPQ